MLTVLTNIRSTKVLHQASCIMHHALQLGGWNTTFIGGHPLLEDDICWKMTIIGRRPSVGRQALVEDDIG